MADFGAKLARLRRQRAMCITQLAVKTGVPWQIIRDIESNRHFPSLRELERLLDALGTTWNLLQDQETK